MHGCCSTSFLPCHTLHQRALIVVCLPFNNAAGLVLPKVELFKYRKDFKSLNILVYSPIKRPREASLERTVHQLTKKQVSVSWFQP